MFLSPDSGDNFISLPESIWNIGRYMKIASKFLKKAIDI